MNNSFFCCTFAFCKVDMTKKNMNQDIRHDGIIDSIDGRHIRVRILQSTACSACKIASRCSASETKEKLIDVETDPTGLHVGQQVVVGTAHAVARKALLLGFGLPLLLMVAVVIGFLLAGASEELSGMAALGSLIPYYILLWLLRHRVARQVVFSIET